MKKDCSISLTIDDCKIIQLALGQLLVHFREVKKNIDIPWTPEARRDTETLWQLANSATKKIEELTGMSSEVPDLEDGEEYDYLTKPS